MINKNIIQIRKELDKLDDSLLEIIKKRSVLVDKVIKNKNFKKDIIDKKRISIILKNIYKKSKIKKIDTTITKKIWVSMIRAFIDYEFRNFKKKKIATCCVEEVFSLQRIRAYVYLDCIFLTLIYLWLSHL